MPATLAYHNRMLLDTGYSLFFGQIRAEVEKGLLN
jgi:hypothetical protein